MIARTPFYPNRASALTSHRNTSFSVYLSDGTRCRGLFYPGRAGAARLVGVYVHGFRSSVAHTKARFFLDHAQRRGYSWCHFDLPCHGRSEGRFRDFRISTALEALLEVAHRFRGAELVLLGSSMGAWLAMLAAQKMAAARAGANATRIAGAVLVAPAFDFFPEYFRDEPPETMREWQHKGARQFTDEYDGRRYELDYAVLEDAARHSVLERPAPARYDFPIRIFHGDQDEIVPLSVTRRFEAAANADLAVRAIAGGDHALNDQLPHIAAAVDRMFQAAEKRAAGQAGKVA